MKKNSDKTKKRNIHDIAILEDIGDTSTTPPPFFSGVSLNEEKPPFYALCGDALRRICHPTADPFLNPFNLLKPYLYFHVRRTNEGVGIPPNIRICVPNNNSIMNFESS